MPNWAENELTITGPNIQKVLEKIRSHSRKDDDVCILDFDKIIPYPKIYRELDQRAQEYENKLAAIPKDDPERNKKLLSLATEYGVEPATLWIKNGYNSGGYEWCCENWSTKWNASSVNLTMYEDNESLPATKTIQCEYCQTTQIIEGKVILVCEQCGSPLKSRRLVRAFLEFQTAWSPPIRVMEKLAAMFPDHAFELKYFEGGMGFSGHALWRDGTEEFHEEYEYDGPRGG